MKKGKKDAQALIVDTLKEKATVKQKVYDNTVETFNLVKDTLQEIIGSLNENLKTTDERISIEYKDRGAFEAEIKVAGDLLIFNMHSNIFEFDKGHGVWKSSYVQKNAMASYCGIINVYNFLADSFKYNRVEDLGYLIARIFINKDLHYFVEGKRQLGFLYNDFANSKINKDTIRSIIESSILYSLDFDLLVPPYDNVSIATVAQVKEKMNKSKIQTGKRLGFKFYADDDEI